MREYPTEELRQKLFESTDRFFLIDALPRASYQHRHLPGALSLPLEEISQRAPDVLPDPEAEVIAYCSGPR
ncbi:MAG: rhodanese-like domain-containing protein [Myxococcales bacterium]|nr:rhodanese-like domain-containing protein [Myxococcales bacterium]